MNFSVRLTPAAVTWLGSAFENKTKISPLQTIQIPGFAESDKASLRDQGILDGQDAFMPDAYVVFNELAEARRFGGFRVSGGFGLIDKMVYFGDHFPVTVDNAGDQLVITANQSPEGLKDILNDIAGSSRLMTAGLDVNMGEKAARVFSSLLDLTRQRALGYYAGLNELKTSFTRAEILHFATSETDERWVTGCLNFLPMEDRTLTSDELEASLKALQESSCVVLHGDEVALAGDASVLATNLLIIEQKVHCKIGELKGDQLFRSEALFLQAGLLDVLMLDSGAEGIGFTTVSPLQMIDYLTAIMTQSPEL